jgi:hypothetical protein
MTEMLSPGGVNPTAPLALVRTRRRRRRVDLRTLATGVVVVIAVAWTIVFGVGIVLS